MEIATVGVADREHRFFTGMALVALLVVFAGFAASYYLWPLIRATHYPSGKPIAPSIPAIVHLHATLFTGWIVLFVLQTRLVASGRTAVHRRIGPIAFALIPAMLLTGLATAIQGGRSGWNPGGPYRDSLGFMIVGLFDMTVFGILAGAGLYFRRRPDLHKRLMLFGTIGALMWPALGRMPIVGGRFVPMFALLAALVLATPVRDLWHRSRLRWVTLAIGLAILLTFPLRAALGNSAGWNAIATWLVR